MFITGTTSDGSDARPVYGMFINPENDNEWSNMPFTNEQKIDEKRFNKYWDIMNFHKNELEFEEISELIKQKKSKLCRKDRDFVLTYLKYHNDEQST